MLKQMLLHSTHTSSTAHRQADQEVQTYRADTGQRIETQLRDQDVIAELSDLLCPGVQTVHVTSVSEELHKANHKLGWYANLDCMPTLGQGHETVSINAPEQQPSSAHAQLGD